LGFSEGSIKHKVHRVLGNHDVFIMGNKVLRSTSRDSYGLEEHDPVCIYKKEKIIVISICSNETEGDTSFAQGKVGDLQYVKLAKELGKIKDIKNYVCIGVLHHHPLQIPKHEDIKKSFIEKSEKLVEMTMKLQDSNKFLMWCEDWNIQLILHGHKHYPFYQKNDMMHIVAAGSSTGKQKHEDKNKIFMSFNIIKLDTKIKKVVSVNLCSVNVLGGKLHDNIKDLDNDFFLT